MQTRTSASYVFPHMEALEARELLAAGGPGAYAQYLLELVNRARANPTAEAALYSITLNEGLPSGTTISTAAKQPLAFNPNLVDAVEGHQTWMFQTETFEHVGLGGSTPLQRMTAAGYVPAGSGENIAVFQPTSDYPNMISDTAGLHESLFKDTTDLDRADRLRMMDPRFREVGISVLGGPITGGTAIAAVEDFAFVAGDPFLTGVVYDNRLALMDGFYTPGEGLGDVTITAVKQGGPTFTTTTWNSGGYSLAVPAGTYDVTFSGGVLSGSFAFNNIVVGISNVKRDLAVDTPPPTADLIVTATPAASRLVYVRPGQGFSIRSAIQNIGNARADGPFNVTVYRSGDAVVDDTDTPIDTYALASLNARATSTSDRALAAPAVAGTYYLAILADDTDIVDESSELNNWGSVITLVVGEPDLQVDFGTFTLPALSVPGDRLSVPLVITNAGTIPAAGTITNEIYASVGLTPNPADVLLASATRAINLAPGASVTVTVSVSITDALAQATWHLLADVDTTNAVLESDEGNNTVATGATFDQVWRFGAFGGRKGAKLSVHDSGGALVTFAATGAGWGSVDLVAAGFNVTMNSSDGGTGVKVTTDGPTTTLNNVTVPGLFKSLVAKADLVGTLDVAGSIATITLADLVDAQINLHTNGGVVTDPRTQVALSLGSVQNSAIDTGDEPVRSFKALEWLDAGGPADTLDAPAVGSIAVRGQKANPAKGLLFMAGDFEPVLTSPGAVGASTVAGTIRGDWTALSVKSLKAAALDTVTIALSQTVDPKLSSLGSLTVTGWMTDSRILAAGNIGAVSLAAVTGSDIFASVVPQAHGLPNPATAFVALPHARIKSVTVTGKLVDGSGHSTIDSDFAAWSLGAFNLANALPTNVPPKAWGLAGHSLDSYKYHAIGLTYTWSILVSPVPIVPGGDFLVTLA